MGFVRKITSPLKTSICNNDCDGRTALHLATCNNHIEIVTWIVNVAGGSLKASRDRYGNTALDDAKRYEHGKIVSLLDAAFK